MPEPVPEPVLVQFTAVQFVAELPKMELCETVLVLVQFTAVQFVEVPENRQVTLLSCVP